ncbi:hypothetical protein WOLCODRAFT_131584 [Wolfiporia cocos MD-104 SS10]|uniref:Uncharacterized protein n=1 Tax=Wolfiporia cocos (strain MD-104) TaxID=742152 RepID=A0A2H3JSX0_WOLCO|nr:hypothetical protein WOLCODRAFT_131584 [Wolfiporia cocos MD-104 SS10]
MLLKWCTLEPTGSANLAAIRFSSPVRVQSIRIFPTDAQPFSQHPEIVSRTEPEAFFLELYFNAYRVPPPHSKEKPKPTNALVPTVLAYVGGQQNFTVPMGTDYATRLMVVRGSYECVSMAIYGEVMSELPPPPTTYEPKALPTIEPIPLSRALDPANSLDPSRLARQLLDLIPDAPPLPLAIRLVFCLKPPSDDWDLPEFPYLHPDLDNDTADFDLDKASRLTTRPVPDDVQDETLLNFAQNVADAVGEKDDNQSYLIAEILAHSASQHPNMAKFLLERLELPKVFDASHMDESILLRLRDAAANADVARSLQSEWFLDLVNTISKDPNVDKATQNAAERLISMIQDWAVLEDTLSNTQGDLVSACKMLKEIGTDEQLLGVWLESMITHHDIAGVLSEIPVMPLPLPHPPYLFGSLKSSISHDEFVAFLRAVVGVAAVLAVYAFADAYPHKRCRERALGIIRLWQGVDGYREIVNRMLLLKQMTFRLECMMDNEDSPRRAGLDAEHILVNLAKDPHAVLQPDLIKCILALQSPHAFITEDERISMRQAAIVADDGLQGAIDELLRPINRPLALPDLRTLRVALAVVGQELREGREYKVVQDFWQDGQCSIVIRLVDIFVPIADEITSNFGLAPPGRKTQELMTQLFRSSDDLLKLLLHLTPAYPLPSRAIAALTTSVADLFVCTDAADLLFSQSSPTCSAAQETRQSCIDVVRTLASPAKTSASGRLGAEVVLGTLLQHGMHVEDRDPVHHLQQVFCLIDFLLPMPDTPESQQIAWTQSVVPTLLQELWAFCRVLDTENKVHIIRRLVNLDRGMVGIGDWLLLEEFRDLHHALRIMEDPSLTLSEAAMRQYQVSMSLRLLLDLSRSSSGISKPFLDCLVNVDEAASIFASCLSLMLDHRLESPVLTDLVQAIIPVVSKTEQNLRISVALTQMRSAQNLEMTREALANLLDSCSSILSTTPLNSIMAGKFQLELGPLFAKFEDKSQPMDTEIAERCVTLLEYFIPPASDVPSQVVLQGITLGSYVVFCDRISEALPADWIQRFDSLKARMSVSEDFPLANPPIPLPDSVKLTMHDVEELLRSAMPPPSTPPRKALNQDVLGLVTLSPPSLIRSPASTGLTKTYNNNDFRQLRQTISARQNTSRLPSMHVDDFESASSPTVVPVPMPMQIPMPLSLTATMPFTADGYQPLAPPFNPL